MKQTFPEKIVDNFFVTDFFITKRNSQIKIIGSGGIRTRAFEKTGALNQRLRPLGHANFLPMEKFGKIQNRQFDNVKN